MTLSEEKEPKDDIVHGLVLEKKTCLHRNQRGDEVVNDEEHR